MLAVIVCSVFTIFLLGGLLAGIAIGVFRARRAIAAALAYERLAPVSLRGSATAAAAPWQPA